MVWSHLATTIDGIEHIAAAMSVSLFTEEKLTQHRRSEGPETDIQFRASAISDKRISCNTAPKKMKVEAVKTELAYETTPKLYKI